MAFFKDDNFKLHMLNEKNIFITEDFINNIFIKYKVNYKIKNLANFQLAMIHISYVNKTTLTEKTAKLLKNITPISNPNLAIPLQDKSYGRLEYLGDAIIHNIIAEYLFTRYDEEDEGFLTKTRIKLENSKTLSKLSKILGLHKYAIIARNLELNNKRTTDVHLTEDIFESFFGALSLEVEYQTCRELFINIIEKELDIAEILSTDDNYKDKLMIYYHTQKWTEPKYIEDTSQYKDCLLNAQGIILEQRMFTVYVKSNNNIIGTGTGSSKIEAEQNAAHQALLYYNIDTVMNDNNDYYGEIDKI
jgi:ribonuclease-3